MAATDKFRQQHAEIIEIVRRMEPMLNPATLAAGAAEARAVLSTLLGKLSIHLAMEDDSLYPRIEKHADAAVRDAAKKFATEISAVKPAVHSFGRKWTEIEIRANAAAFCAEAKKLFTLLGDRIQRENTQFYPLIDKAG
jgi:hemerythrin-like domain-containing protein